MIIIQSENKYLCSQNLKYKNILIYLESISVNSQLMKLKNDCQSSMNLFTIVLSLIMTKIVQFHKISIPPRRATEIPRRGAAKRTQFPRGWGQLLEVFFPVLRGRLVSYQILTAALLSKLSVILLLTFFQNKNHCFHRCHFTKGRLNPFFFHGLRDRQLLSAYK